MLALYISCKSGYMPEMFVTIKYKPFWPHFFFFLSSPVHSFICLMSFDLCGCSYKHLENEIDQSCLLSYLLSQFFVFRLLYYFTRRLNGPHLLHYPFIRCYVSHAYIPIQFKSNHFTPHQLFAKFLPFFWKRN